MPARYLAPGITVLTIVGAYAVRTSVVDVMIMLVLGVAGYFLSRAGISAAPIVLGLILGSIAETGLVQGLLTSQGEAVPWLTFFTRPLSLVLIAMTLISLLWPVVRSWRQRRRSAGEEPQEPADDLPAETVRKD